MVAPGWEAVADSGTPSSSSSSSPWDARWLLKRATDGPLKRISAPDIALDKWLVPLVSQVLWIQLAHVKVAIKDPFRDVGKQVHQLIRDLALTREQQEVLERVIACNMNFWDVAVSLRGQGYPPWSRHLGLNMALLRVYHCHLAASTCARALVEGQASPPPMSRGDAEDALRYCRWMAASYCYRWGALPTRLTEPELARRAAAIVGVDSTAILASELSDASQPYDPLLPRFLLALDIERNEVILSIRGTATLSDLFIDLIGDVVPFAAGVAHDGICDAARRLRLHVEDALQAALRQLDARSLPSEEGEASPRRRRRLVLTGHSLGAGIAELLAIMLHGGDVGHADMAARWQLPEDVDLAVYLYGPAPVYGPDPMGGAGAAADEADAKKAQEAVRSAMAGSIGFAINYDIIPRTSLHNGYKLFQQARVVDAYLRWQHRETMSFLHAASKSSPLQAAQAQAAIVSAVEAAIAEAAASAPALSNPFALQHPVVGQMHHIIGAPGGTSASLEQMTDAKAPTPSPDPEDEPGPRWLMCARRRRHLPPLRPPPREAGPGEASASATPSCSHSGWLWKRSNIIGEWRRRFAWIAGGELRLADDTDARDAKAVVPLTAGATVLELLGLPSDERFPESVVVCNGEGGFVLDDTEAVGAICGCPGRPGAGSRIPPTGRGGATQPPYRSLRRPTAWAFKVETFAAGGACPVAAATVQLCAETAAERDAWTRALVDAVRAARRVCYRVQPAVPPEDFGREALLAEGLLADHQVIRYEAALETLLESCKAVEESPHSSPTST